LDFKKLSHDPRANDNGNPRYNKKYDDFSCIQNDMIEGFAMFCPILKDTIPHESSSLFLSFVHDVIRLLE
jgi:hypothetical protein